MKKAKNKNNLKVNSSISTDNEMSKLILLIVIVALIFGLFYLITLFVTKKDNESSSSSKVDDTQVSIQYKKVLASNILSQKPAEYYVLVYFKDDKFVDYYKNYLEYYSSNVENSVAYYYVDMDEVFNSSFVSDKSNLNVDDINNIKFSQTALLRIRDGKVISSYEGNENITGKLGRMTK
jgi:flagellar basal body-associated protein FliL